VIRSLRFRHRRVAAGIIVVAPVILVVAINARTSIPSSPVPEPLGALAEPVENTIRERLRIGRTWFDVGAWSAGPTSYIEMVPTADSLADGARRHPEIHGADVVAYLSNEPVHDLSGLDQAIRLGSMRGATRVVFSVPVWPGPTPYLTLASLARAEILGSQSLPPEVVSVR
jgi:hypothetical protein